MTILKWKTCQAWKWGMWGLVLDQDWTMRSIIEVLYSKYICVHLNVVRTEKRGSKPESGLKTKICNRKTYNTDQVLSSRCSWRCCFSAAVVWKSWKWLISFKSVLWKWNFLLNSDSPSHCPKQSVEMTPIRQLTPPRRKLPLLSQEEQQLPLPTCFFRYFGSQSNCGSAEALKDLKTCQSESLMYNFYIQAV